MIMRARAICRFLILCVGIAGTSMAAAGTTRDIKLRDGAEVSVNIYPAPGEAVLLWLPSGLDGREAEERLAEALAAQGLEVWRPDLMAARLLPPLESSLDQIPDGDIAGLIDAARAGGRRVVLLASARAGVLALRGARAWQVRHPVDTALAGAILLHPNLFLGPPEPGKEADYHPAAAQTRVPVYILQPERSPWHWRLDSLKAELAKGGTPVFIKALMDVRDRFYFRPDATTNEAAETKRLPGLLREAVTQLKQAKAARAPAAAPLVTTAAPKADAPRERALKPYKGDPLSPRLRLADLAGRARDIDDYRGRVVLVNFWAAWCPPCVREMPSLQRLQDKLKDKPFTILAVNMAETEAEVRDFLANKVKVDFTILMDRDGQALKVWKVFVFPTSFVLGPDGKIKYGLYGELEWDKDDVVKIIEGLLPPP
jgi:thiol-disulfide isomerase/thioredoxin